MAFLRHSVGFNQNALARTRHREYGKANFPFFHRVSLVSFLYVQLTLNFKQLARYSRMPSYKDFRQFCNPGWHWTIYFAAILIATVCLHLKTIVAIVNKLFHNHFFSFSIFKENVTWWNLLDIRSLCFLLFHAKSCRTSHKIIFPGFWETSHKLVGKKLEKNL